MPCVCSRRPGWRRCDGATRTRRRTRRVARGGRQRHRPVPATAWRGDGTTLARSQIHQGESALGAEGRNGEVRQVARAGDGATRTDVQASGPHPALFVRPHQVPRLHHTSVEPDHEAVDLHLFPPATDPRACPARPWRAYEPTGVETTILYPVGSRSSKTRAPQGMSSGPERSSPPRSRMPAASRSMSWAVVK